MAATEDAHSQALDSLIEAVSGSVGGFVSASSLLPLDVVKTRMQAGAKGSYLMILQSVISEKGFIGLYKGFQYVGFSSAYEKFMYVLSHFSRARWENHANKYYARGCSRTFAHSYCRYFYIYSFWREVFQRR